MRAYPENDLTGRPALRVIVGVSDADIVGGDNRAIQAAIDYVGNLGGGTVEIGPGEYLLYDSIHMRTRVTLRGAGEKTVLKKAASAYSLLAADGDFGEEAITLEDPAGFDVGQGVWIGSKRMGGFHSICATITNRDGNYFTISRPLNADCMMAHEAFAATVFPAISAFHVREFRIESIVIDGNRTENAVRINGCRGAGIFFYQGDAGVIADCVVRGYNGDGISFQQSNDVQVVDCRVEGNAGGGLHPGSGSQRAEITGCRSIGNDGDGFFFCWRVRHATVKDCEFRDNAGVGMSIGHKDSDNVIRANVITGNAKGGVFWRKEDEPMAAHRIEFVGNTVKDNGEFGLFIDGETDGTVVRGNTVGGQEVGIRIGKDAGGVALDGNTIQAKTEVMDERD